MFNSEAKKEAKKAEEIRTHILELLAKQGNQLDDLSVTFDDGIVTLAGNCDSTKTRDKALLMAKNVDGVKDVKDGGLRVPQAGAAPAPTPAAPAQAPAQAPAKAPSSPFAAAAGSAAQAASRAAAPAAPQPAPQAQPQAAQPVTPPPAAPQPQAQAQPAAAETMYTIQAGDNLSKIAKKFYGDANKYMVIFEANKDTLKDPDKIFPGKQIRIPQI